MMIDRKILLKFISGKASLQEKSAVLDWIDQSEENMNEFIKQKNNYVFEKMDSYGRDSKANGAFFRLKNMIKYAAVFFLAVSLTAVGYYFLDNIQKSVIHEQSAATFKYMVNTGVKGMVVLPDGSKVWLNSSSHLICPQEFSNDVREVEIDGEGYFEVVKNKDWPMIVKTSKDYSVKVTGTSFNLSSYSDDDKLVVTLISGEVSLINKKQNKEIKMVPNQELVVLLEKPQINENVDTNKKTAWKEGLLLFENTPMKEVIKKLERWYGVFIEVKDQDIFDERFTAKFKSESISQVLEILKLSSNIKYSIDGTNITLEKN
ncbi:MAG: FecR family protein [Bacteroidales bacterium]|nr:FecR family protein [Bacteroidales bacterium]